MKTTIPATKMDLLNTDRAELFANDGGFKLIQETTRDGALITAAKEAKEAAAAAAAAAQLSFF